MSEPDILVRLRDCAGYTTAHNMDGLTTALTDARDEIVALRSFAEGCRGAAGQIRAEALEEAAQELVRKAAEIPDALEGARDTKDIVRQCASYIRVLKDERHE